MAMQTAQVQESERREAQSSTESLQWLDAFPLAPKRSSLPHGPQMTTQISRDRRGHGRSADIHTNAAKSADVPIVYHVQTGD